MDTAQIVLEFLRTLLSTQVVAGSVAIAFLWKFAPDIRALMQRVAKLRFPGGSEVSMSQLEQETAQPAIAAKKEPEALKGPVASAPSDEEKKSLEARLTATNAEAHVWEYRYLNYYLVQHTQRVLDWLAAATTPVTYKLYDTWWMPVIGDPNERQAVIRALESHHLIEIKKELLEVTPKGREYATWRGPTPPPAPAS